MASIDTWAVAADEIIESAWGNTVRQDLNDLNNAKVEKGGDHMSGRLAVGPPGSAGYTAQGSYVGADGWFGTHVTAKDNPNVNLTRSGDANAGDQLFVSLLKQSGSTRTLLGSIRANSGNDGIVFSNNSDRRLKDDLGEADLDDLLAIVTGVTPRKLRWKSSGREFVGIIADELAEHVPDAVYGVADAVYADDYPDEAMRGQPDYQQVDFQSLIVPLVGAVGALLSKLDALTERVRALEVIPPVGP